MNATEHIYDDIDPGNGMELVAIVVRAHYKEPGVGFFTDPKSSLQVGSIQHGQGHVIQPHAHPEGRREILRTQEVLIVREGIIRVDLYNRQAVKLTHRVLYRGDMILLAGGGHALEFLQEGWLWEVKSGPYLGNADKTYLPR